MIKKTQSNRYEELDALRGIAALMVVFFHFTMGKPQAKLGFKLGTTGVDLFFIISGFVIFMSLTKAKNSKEFVINRVSRLYPTYWACVTFTFILIVIDAIYKHYSIPLFKYLGNMTMFQFYLRIPDLDGPYWTMIIEMIFYICILFLFHFKLTKYLNIIGIAISALVVILTSFFYNQVVEMTVKAIPLLQFIPLFFAGTVFYKIYTEKNNLIEKYLILIFCLVAQIFLFHFAGRSAKYIDHSEYAMMLIIYFTLFVLFVNHKLNFMVSKVTLFFGELSFALYLVHQLISVKYIIPFFTNKLHVNFWITSLFVALPIVVFIATFITFKIEKPLRKKMKEKLLSISLSRNQV